jgi:uncharacterized membrane protein YfcA
MQPEYLIGLVSFFASLLTFFSGFGLGTLLLPVFAMFYDLNSAVLLTACVHLLNNVFKFALVYRNINWQKALTFSLFALPASLFGAWLLGVLNNSELNAAVYKFNNLELKLSAIKTSLGILMLFFGFWELFPRAQKFSLAEKWFGIFAFLSGLIGGFSGHQGALRTIVLSKAKLEKQAFVATGICIACFVDLARIPVYVSENSMRNISMHAILPAVLPAFAGAWLGNRFLMKIEVKWLKWIVGAYLIVMGALVGLGLI